jgi:DNA primase
MDSVLEIKSRLSIDQLVGRYVQLQKKGRNFVGLCPFHHDTKPSFLVSPDKGICYCFPCQKGGDIFSFYQLIEGVDFKQAIKDLADIAGVTLPEAPVHAIKKDEKERMRDCLTAAASFYKEQLKKNTAAQEYLAKRGVSAEEIAAFNLGVAPDSFNATYEYLLKAGYSRKEIMGAGLGIQKDLKDERIYDRFRHRLMFPIYDQQDRIIGFGGRTLGNDDAKYLNTSDGPLYHKSSVLFGLNRAHKAMRDQKRAVIVEGYFDVLACHRVGVMETVATCGTALTEEHAKLLKRSVDTVVLCLDSDRAGREAAQRGFIICSKEGLQVQGVTLGQKDPADAVQESPDLLKKILTESARPFLDLVFAEIRTMNLSDPAVMSAALQRILPLLRAITSSSERQNAVRQGAAVLGIQETALTDDLHRYEQAPYTITKTAQTNLANTSTVYSSAELTIGLFLLYPRTIGILKEMIAPEEPFAAMLYNALMPHVDTADVTVDMLSLSDEDRERARILHLYCEENGFADWSESIAIREIRRNCFTANKEQLHRKQKDITRRMLEAGRAGKKAEQEALEAQYQQLLQLSRQVQ